MPDCRPDGFDGAGGTPAQQMFEFGEDLLDGIEIGRVFWQKEQLGLGRLDGLAHRLALVAAEIVHDHHIAGSQGGDENHFDISPEAVAVDRAVEDPWRIDAIMAQRGEEGHGFPVAVRHLGPEPLAARRPPPERRHVGLGPGLVNEDQTLGIDPALILFPPHPPSRDVGTILFAGVHGFF